MGVDVLISSGGEKDEDEYCEEDGDEDENGDEEDEEGEEENGEEEEEEEEKGEEGVEADNELDGVLGEGGTSDCSSASASVFVG
ncbi:hypothetical protein C0989_002819 [Termitomyces sp. Mn162]|nr:hypothetical protein C0989_002819 [Termitomyces sp. Mn162]